MRDFVLCQAEALERSRPFPTLRRLFANWRKRRRLRELEKLDDHVLDDIGVSRADLLWALSQPVTVDPDWELERRARLARRPMPDATRRWLHDPAFGHPKLPQTEA